MEDNKKKNFKAAIIIIVGIVGVVVAMNLYEEHKRRLLWDEQQKRLMETRCNNVSNNNGSVQPPIATSHMDESRNNRSQTYVTCPICKGTGYREIIPNDFMSKSKCPCCQGRKVCTKEEAEINLRFQEMFSGHPRGRSAYEIRRDIDKANKLLEDMEYQYHNSHSRTNAARYPSMMSNTRERIQKLEMELQNASY